MKSTAWIINGVLAAAIIVLFVLHFKGATPSSATGVNNVNSKIAYFESDSIENNYGFVKEVKDSLEFKSQQKQIELNGLKKDYFAKLQNLQKYAQSMSQAEAAQLQQEVITAEKNYGMKEQQFAAEMQEESYRRMTDVKKKIEEFLAVYNKGKKYDYIFSNSTDLIFYKDPANDITADIIKGLNEAYKNKK
jgi:outer membrane protein